MVVWREFVSVNEDGDVFEYEYTATSSVHGKVRGEERNVNDYIINLLNMAKNELYKVPENSVFAIVDEVGKIGLVCQMEYVEELTSDYNVHVITSINDNGKIPMYISKQTPTLVLNDLNTKWCLGFNDNKKNESVDNIEKIFMDILKEKTMKNKKGA